MSELTIDKSTREAFLRLAHGDPTAGLSPKVIDAAIRELSREFSTKLSIFGKQRRKVLGERR